MRLAFSSSSGCVRRPCPSIRQQPTICHGCSPGPSICHACTQQPTIWYGCPPEMDSARRGSSESSEDYVGLWTGVGYRDAQVCGQEGEVHLLPTARRLGEDPVFWLRQQGWWTPSCGKAPWSRAQCLQCQRQQQNHHH